MDSQFTDDMIAAMQHDAFIVVFTGETPDSKLLYGFEAMFAHIVEQTGVSETSELDDIKDIHSWRTNDDGEPLIYDTEFGEGCYLTIVRAAAN